LTSNHNDNVSYIHFRRQGQTSSAPSPGAWKLVCALLCTNHRWGKQIRRCTKVGDDSLAGLGSEILSHLLAN